MTEGTERLWAKHANTIEYHNCFPPHHQHGVDDIVQYYRTKFPQHETTKIPFAMDLACGTGKFTEFLADHCERVVASDISPSQIEAARQFSTHANVDYAVSSVYEVSKLVGTEKADLVMVGNASHYFNNKRFYDEVRRCLKVGGVLAEVMQLIVDFPELPKEAFNRYSEFSDLILTNHRSDEVYNRYFDLALSQYKNLEVFMEEKVYKSIPFKCKWSRKQLRDYLVFSTMKSRDYGRDVEEFLDKLWQDFNIGDEGLLMQVNMSFVYSINGLSQS